MSQIDFEKEAKDSLAEWMMDHRDRQFITALTNDITNCVVADATNGFKDTTLKKSVKEATKEITKGDVVSVKTIRRAIFLARTGQDFKGGDGSYPIKPIRAQSYPQNGINIMHYSYIIMLDSYGISQLKNDSEWQDIQKFAGDRGDKNNLFMGLAGMIDGCPVLDFGVWSNSQAGLCNSEVKDSSFLEYFNKDNANGKIVKPSEYAGNDTPVSIGFLIGASALLIAGSMQPRVYMQEVDAGRKLVVGMDRVMAIAKARFGDESHVQKYANKDFSTIGIFYSKE